MKKDVNSKIYQSHSQSISGARAGIAFWANIGLACSTLLLLGFYVLHANMMAAAHYEIKQLNEQVTLLTDGNSALSAQRTQLEDPSLLAEFAVSHNMVEAKDTLYLFDGGNVALQR